MLRCYTIIQSHFRNYMCKIKTVLVNKTTLYGGSNNAVFYEMGNLVSMYQFRVNFTRDCDVRWVHISLFGRSTATCLQSFEKKSTWYVTFKRNGSRVRHQFIIVDSSYQPQWRLHLLISRLRQGAAGIATMWRILSLYGVIQDLWAGKRENYIKFK